MPGDSTPVSVVGCTPIVPVVDAKVPATNAKELIVRQNARNGEMNDASGGHGTIPHPLPECVMKAWFAFVGLQGLPPAEVQPGHTAVVSAFADPGVKAGGQDGQRHQRAAGRKAMPVFRREMAKYVALVMKGAGTRSELGAQQAGTFGVDLWLAFDQRILGTQQLRVLDGVGHGARQGDGPSVRSTHACGACHGVGHRRRLQDRGRGVWW